MLLNFPILSSFLILVPKSGIIATLMPRTYLLEIGACESKSNLSAESSNGSVRDVRSVNLLEQRAPPRPHARIVPLSLAK